MTSAVVDELVVCAQTARLTAPSSVLSVVGCEPGGRVAYHVVGRTVMPSHGSVVSMTGCAVLPPFCTNAILVASKGSRAIPGTDEPSRMGLVLPVRSHHSSCEPSLGSAMASTLMLL